MSRGTRAKQGQETVEIVERGWYELPGGRRGDFSDKVKRCLAETTVHKPEELQQLVDRLQPPSDPQSTTFHVTGETTLAAARRLICEELRGRVLALNFASAKNPGGGFLGGSQAQEESLARSSALYASLLTQPTYYDANRSSTSAFYTDHLILSPDVPVIRDDDGNRLELPYLLSILTAPAVNAGAVQTNSPRLADRILPTMRTRLTKILALAAAAKYEHLLLGAWGCGVFRNDPEQIAELFADSLVHDKRFRGRFRSVTFAVLDTSADQRIISPFRRLLGAL
jgi:uncharacterized protein (TIGR02452 family)